MNKFQSVPDRFPVEGGEHKEPLWQAGCADCSESPASAPSTRSETSALRRVKTEWKFGKVTKEEMKRLTRRHCVCSADIWTVPCEASRALTSASVYCPQTKPCYDLWKTAVLPEI